MSQKFLLKTPIVGGGRDGSVDENNAFHSTYLGFPKTDYQTGKPYFGDV